MLITNYKQENLNTKYIFKKIKTSYDQIKKKKTTNLSYVS